MPYKVVGNKVYHKKGGKWSVKQTAKSPTNAKKALHLLNAVEHGMGKKKGRKRKLSSDFGDGTY